VKAALLEHIPSERVLDDVQTGAIGPHDVLVRTVAAGLCHSDLRFMEGKYPCAVPTVLGHESAGVVEAVAAQVTYLRPGEGFASLRSGEVARPAHHLRLSAPDELRRFAM
jgi:S-(hydroxymethyl)glutathione dehydrogenase / alcohol dehydrogenase